MSKAVSLESGSIPLREIPGPFDLQATIESGQTYLWNRRDNNMFAGGAVHGGSAWYQTVVPPIDGVSTDSVVIELRQTDTELEWHASDDPIPLLTHLLRLDDDLNDIYAKLPSDSLITNAIDAFEGMRLVRDPPFVSLISFICSAQMRVSRIHQMQKRLAETYGQTVTADCEQFHVFPTSSELSTATEESLRDLKLGYRAPYVLDTAEMVARDEAHPEHAATQPYEQARSYLTQFTGVGNKVADCVLLFALGYLEAVPLDTWIQSAIEEHYPNCTGGTYAETSRAIRRQLGGELAGYAQTYVFYYLRSSD